MKFKIVKSMTLSGIRCLLIMVPLILTTNACEEFINIDPPKTQIVSETVFTDDGTATSAILGIYSKMMDSEGFVTGGYKSITHLGGLSSDEFLNYSPVLDPFALNSIQATNADVKTALWDPAYAFIYSANSILKGLEGSTGVTQETKNQLVGEAKFIRAFCHFYLLNFFGNVPIVTSIDYRINNKLFRDSTSQVYDHIILDLKDAQDLLAPDYSYSLDERIRPNKWAAAALLSRVYLYTEDWGNAEITSTSVIDNNEIYQLEPDLNSVFLMNSLEAIWQLMPVTPETNTFEAGIFIPAYPSEYFTIPDNISLSDGLVNGFEPGDNRMINWVDSMTSIEDGKVYFYPYKYKVFELGMPLTEYYTVLRLAEQYLIRAEARANQEKLSESIDDVDVIRERAGLPLIRATNPSIAKADLLLAIEQERRIELFAEWSHRWFDLKRTDRSNAVLGITKENWQSTDIYYPIPQSDRQNNPNLSQNFGY